MVFCERKGKPCVSPSIKSNIAFWIHLKKIFWYWSIQIWKAYESVVRWIDWGRDHDRNHELTEPIIGDRWSSWCQFLETDKTISSGSGPRDNYLVSGAITTLKNMSSSMGRMTSHIITYMQWKIKHVWNHQPVIKWWASLKWISDITEDLTVNWIISMQPWPKVILIFFESQKSRFWSVQWGIAVKWPRTILACCWDLWCYCTHANTAVK